MEPLEPPEPGKSIAARFRERFGRRTSSGRFIPEVDGLRFPAIAIVVFGHLASFFIDRPLAPKPLTALDRFFVGASAHAGEGVLLFFVISGFVLALPFASAYLEHGPRVRLRSYYLRRLTRLEPPYLISLVVFLLFKIFARKLHLVAGTESTDVLLRHFGASALYLHNLIYGTPSLINGVAWSLEIEIQFYLLVPLLTLVFCIRSAAVRRTIIVIVALAAIAVQQRLILGEGRLSLSVVGCLQFFLFGFLLADLYLTDRIGAGERGFGWDIASLVAWPALFVMWTGETASPVLLPFACLAAFVAVFRGRLTNRVFTNPWITTFGGMCYSIYLLHFMLIGIAGKVLLRRVPSSGVLWRDIVVQGPVLLVVALGCSVVYYALIELPCMDKTWPKRLAARVRSRVRPTPVSYVGRSEM